MITLILDASVVKHSSCLLRLWRIAREGWRDEINTVNIEYGSAWHIFKEEFLRSNGVWKTSWDKAARYFLEIPKIHPGGDYKWLDIGHLQATCLAYKTKYGKDTTKSYGDLKIEMYKGKPLLEVTFAFTYYKSSTLTIILAGTIDEITLLPYNIYGLGDDKTSSKYEYEEHLQSFESSHQLRFYEFAVNRLGAKYPDSLWGQITSKGAIGCYINGVFVNSKKPALFKRSKFFRYDGESREEFAQGIDNIIARLQRFVDSKAYRPIREGFSNGACLYCPFTASCMAEKEEIREHILAKRFTQVKYNPLKFRKQNI